MNDIDRILFEDEAMIRDYQAIGRTWFLKGKQRIIPTYGKHLGVKLVGTLDYETGEIFCVEEERYDASVFLEFLKKIIVKYPGQRIVMILDNAKIHHAKLLLPFLKEHEYILELVFLPPYSPNLNLIEEFWGWLKRSCVYNVFYSSVKEIRNRVQTFVAEVNKQQEKVIDRLCTVM
ncbi:transposase (fragment) [Candidatus Desulfosporosinus infrequens]|uniref:Transposase n=1 Tax=Candidatus Desulfosporosinus infrequens TaxID=2043169 RepID=A0A2U3LK83_9FIRM